MTGPLLHGHLEASATAHPDRRAVTDEARSLTYAELEASANRVAHLLLDLGVSRGDRVGLFLDKSIESIVGAYGVLKAGAAYVPLDPNAPVARLSYIVGDCGMRVLLSSRAKAGSWGSLAAGMLQEVVSMDGDGESAQGDLRVLGTGALATLPETSPAVATRDADLAYILYTSGSTGEPKGVMLSHRNALTFVDWAADLVAVGPEDRLSSHAPLHFDLSVFDLYAAARGGASVHLVPPEASVLPRELRSFLRQARITVWYSVPSVLTSLTLRGGLEEGDLPDLRAVIFAGEVFPTKFLRRLMAAVPHAEFLNWYGPTETNVCTWYRVPPLPKGNDEPIPIGRAIAETEVFAVTSEGRRAAHGETGELHVRGPGVMQGYWGDPERTRRALVPNPVGGTELVYRTGDLVQELPDGNYRFLGRRDAQVKSRGYRIELGDVEAALLSHPRVVEAAVVAVPDEQVTSRLRAHVVAEGVSEGELMAFCRRSLPRYMVPESFHFLEALPKTSTGKIDRRSLEGSGAAAVAVTDVGPSPVDRRR